ncbi:MAG: nicotinate-nucleotide adenylyltransferase [Gorillibacterium sp.]|nr:nicotinate-nucleotide adenylyltransferase [Gorillibacterium sp.]
MRIGIMGGTFDPIHYGHLLAAERVGEEAGLDEVWFMPANVPPHKRGQLNTAASHRLRMVELAIGDNPHFRVANNEVEKGGTSYTVDTMSEIVAKHPSDEFSYIVGTDMIMYLPKWYRIDDLVRIVTFIGVGRPGYELKLHELAPELQSRVKIVPMPLMEISSTHIRERCRNGQSIRYLLPDTVLDYIEVNRLYDV